jgi:Putative zincin peptidase
MRTTKQLPAAYAAQGVVDLSRDRRAQTLLAVGGVALFILFGIGFFAIAAQLRPAVSSGSLAFGLVELLIGLVALLALMYAVVVLHEAVHGACYWLFTRERPRFGLSVLYAWAAAPEWYLPRAPFLVVGLAPLVVISFLGVGALYIVPDAAVFWIVLALTLNAAGCVGDIAVAVWALTRSRDALFNDRGPMVTAYAPTA